MSIRDPNAVKLFELQHLNDILAEAMLILPNITDLTEQNIEDICNKIDEIKNEIELIRME